MGSHRQRQTLLLRAACGSIRDNRARAACGALWHLIYCIVLCAGLWITRCFGEQWLVGGEQWLVGGEQWLVGGEQWLVGGEQWSVGLLAHKTMQ